MKTVYIINKSAHDYEDAKQYGDFVFLSEGTFDKFDTNKIYRQFYEILASSKPDDYILLTGLPIMQGIAMTIMSALHGRLNLLLFKGGKNGSFYIERNLVTKETQDG